MIRSAGHTSAKFTSWLHRFKISTADEEMAAVVILLVMAFFISWTHGQGI